MVNFDKIIASCLEEGMKPEDIASQVTTALNAAKRDPKEDWLDALENKVTASIHEDGCLSIDDHIAGIVHQLSIKHKNWTLDQLKIAYQSIEDNLHAVAVLIDAENNGTLEKTALTLINEAIESGLDRSKVVDTPKTKVAVEKLSSEDIDGETIARFLKNIM